MPDAMIDLTERLRGLWVARDDAVVTDMLAAWPSSPYRPHHAPPKSLPVRAHLPVARAVADARYFAFVDALIACQDSLPWGQTYDETDIGPAWGDGFLDKYGWAILLGADGVFESPDLIAAVMLLGPGITYPVHAHAPEELYLVLAGRASWRLDDGPWRVLDPGVLIHNPPWRRHGMRTDQGEPLLVANLTRAGAHERSRILG